MTTGNFYLFGPPHLTYNGQNIAINLRKAVALLAYLALNPQAHSRDTLAALLWPGKASRIARANLRRTLYDLAQQLATGGLQLVASSEEAVQLGPDAALWIDVAAFQQYLADHLPPTPTTLLDSSALDALTRTAELYADDFMAGFTLPDAPAFDDWQFFQREELRQQYGALLATLVATYAAQRNYDQAIHYARRWSQLDLLEEAVHRQLMTLYAQAGQIAAAVRQYDECVHILQQELEAPPAEETTALFAAIRTRRFPTPDKPVNQPDVAKPADKQTPLARGAPVVPKPLATPPGREPAKPVHNLPRPTTPFIGRAQELAELLRRLADPACQLLTLIGPGGIGKTRLALAAALHLVENTSALRFADGIFWVELHGVQGVSGVLAALATATNFRFYSDVPLHEQILRFLGEKELLLILDNFEHLLDEAPAMVQWISDLLVAAPKIKLLVTSHAPLNLQEEWFHPLGGMALPKLETRSPALLATRVADNPVADAVQLFVQNARRAQPGFDPVAERVAVAQICRLVDGVPLALELAATWLKVLPCAQIAQEIAQNLDILTTRHQNIPMRHRSMRAVLEQAWHLLDAEEQQVLLRLTVFRSGFTQAAAAAVAGAALRTLATLAEKALLQITQDRLAHNRYQMHALLHQFAAERVTASPAAVAQTQARHSDYYLTLLQQQAPHLLGAEQQQAVQVIGGELDNIRAALMWAIQAGNSARLVQVLDPFYSFYQIQSRYLEGRELFVAALAQWRLAAQTMDETAQVVQIQLLARCGALSYLLGEYGVAGDYLQAARGLAEARALAHELALIFNFLGRLAVWQGEKTQAADYLTQSLHLSQTLGARDRTASALEKLANLVHATFGEYRESKALVLQSLRLSRELGRPDRIAYALDALGFVTFCLGEYTEAEAYYGESLRIFDGSGDHYGRAMALGGLALVYWALGGARLGDATAYFQQSLFICRELGHSGQVAGRLAGLARVANDQGDYTHAQQLAAEGLALARGLGSPVYLSHLLYCLGETAYAVGELPAARTYLLEALQVTSATGLLANLAIALFHYATLLIKESEGDPSGATRKRSEALALLLLVQNHPATWQVYKARALHQSTALRARLSIIPAADEQTYRASSTLNDVVREILALDADKRG